jgi:transposase InsO family protein
VSWQKEVFMSYTSNPYMGKVRRLAVNDVRLGRLNQAQTARKYGVTRSAVCKWIKRASPDHREFIETLSSKPKSHPNQLSPKIVKRIVDLRKRLKRCAPVIHAHLEQEGIKVSLSSVTRTLRREGLTRKKARAKWQTKVTRPVSDQPGALVQADTIHIVKPDYSRFFIYTVLDTFTRLAYAEYHRRITQYNSISVIKKANDYFGFPFKVIQTDNGPEFRQRFNLRLRSNQIKVRHSRVRKPNDNAHVERFNRTLQEECFRGRQPREKSISRQLKEYLIYYNQERLHLSLNCMTPRQFVSKVLN